MFDEKFAIPGVGGIMVKEESGKKYILIQERFKEDAILETGMLEIPAGKIREFENIFDCLRREINEETGYTVSCIEGEKEAEKIVQNGYTVLNYKPFSCSQNIDGKYPIMVQVFICHLSTEKGGITESSEAKNIRWVEINELKKLLKNENRFYPMHISTLRKYLKRKQKSSNITIAST